MTAESNGGTEPVIPEPIEGYKAFLVKAAKQRQHEQDWMTVELMNILKMRGCSLVEQAVIARAAEHALIALRHGGFELALDEWGELKYVVT